MGKVDPKRFYVVRTSNSLRDLKKWVRYASKSYPKQKFILVNNYKEKISDKKNKEYWKMRFKSGYESKYYVYGSVVN